MFEHHMFEAHMFDVHMFDVHMLEAHMLEVHMFDPYIGMFEVHMFEHHMFVEYMFGACGRDGEAIAGASMEKDAMNGTANAPAAAAPLSRARLLGARGPRSSPESSTLTCISSPFCVRPA
jgi:hypothetical protein